MKRTISLISLTIVLLSLFAFPVCAQEAQTVERRENEEENARSMPYTATFYQIFQIYDPMGLGWATIRMDVAATIDAQNGYIISVDNITAIQRGENFNFVGWQVDDDDISYSIDNINGAITATVVGRLTVEMTTPLIGTTIGNTSRHTLSHTFFVY